MNNQKDTQKTGLDSYGHNNLSNSKALFNKPSYNFVNKKTEKLVTALYMVTDCMESDDAIKSKLRHLGVDLLSHMYKLGSISPIEKNIHISSSLSHIHEILSFIEMAYTIGYISDMNNSILKREFEILIKELESSQSKDKHFTFTLDENMFVLPKNEINENNININNGLIPIKDKRTTSNTMSFISKQLSYSRPARTSISVISDKKDRMEKILNIIKNSSNGHLGVSIKDISASFTDCSEKTIQRELNTLVLDKKINKVGSKRWSRYSLVK